MSDGNFRLVICKEDASKGARAWAGVRDEAGERIRSIEGHRRRVAAVAFDPRGTGDLWVSVGDDGAVGVWTTKEPSSAPATTPRLRVPGRMIWEAALPDRVVSAAAARAGDGPAKGCIVAFDEAKATIAVGMTDGAVHIWTDIFVFPDAVGVLSPSTSGAKFLSIPSSADSPVDFLALNGPTLLVHLTSANSFCRVNISTTTPIITTFGHKADHLGLLTAFALDFTSPAPPPTLSVRLPPPTLRFPTLAFSPASGLPPSTSIESIDSLASLAPDELAPTGNAFGQRKYVVAGDAQGRVFIWDWEADETGEVIEPRRMVQGFMSKVTALAVSDAAVFIGWCVDLLRCC